MPGGHRASCPIQSSSSSDGVEVLAHPRRFSVQGLVPLVAGAIDARVRIEVANTGARSACSGPRSATSSSVLWSAVSVVSASTSTRAIRHCAVTPSAGLPAYRVSPCRNVICSWSSSL